MRTSTNKTYRRGKSRREHIISSNRRLLITVLVAFCTVIAGSGLIRTEAATKTPDQVCSSLYTGIKLADGDTLESIASIYNNYDNMDDDEYIEQIKKINNLYDDNVHPGCFLTVMYSK